MVAFSYLHWDDSCKQKTLFLSAFIFSPFSLGIVMLLCFKLCLLSLPSCHSAVKVKYFWSLLLASTCRSAFDTWTAIFTCTQSIYNKSQYKVYVLFSFYDCSTMWVQLKKTVWNYCYASVLGTVLTGFERSKIFEHLYQIQPASSRILPGLCFRSWISLPVGLCSVSTTSTELQIQWQHDQSLAKPCPPSESSWK